MFADSVAPQNLGTKTTTQIESETIPVRENVHMKDRNIRIHAEIAAKLNFAAHQSTFPLLRDLRVENLHSEERIEGLVLKLQANPAFINEKCLACGSDCTAGIGTNKESRS